MKILIGHNYYQQPGGEDAVFRSEVNLLRSFGHDVCLYERRNDEIKSGLASRVQHLTSLRQSKKSYDDVRRLIDEFKPDAAHFHNTFFVMTPSVFYACKDAGVPVIVSLHNFRLMCVNGLFFRDNHPCEDCLHGSRWSGIVHKCYRGSLLSSAVLTDMIAYHWRRKTWMDCVDCFIVATEFSRQKHIQAGIPAEKISVLGHFVEDSGHLPADQRGDYALYAGRLSEEKGIDVLLKAWKTIKDIPLFILGSGPKKADIEAHIKNENMTNVKVFGFLENREYAEVFRRARCVIVPSVCYENFPRVVVEAYACGIPVIASRLGTMEEIVEEGVTGRLFTAGVADDLARQVRELINNTNDYSRLCAGARRVYESRYSPAGHHQGLIERYSLIRS